MLSQTHRNCRSACVIRSSKIVHAPKYRGRRAVSLRVRASATKSAPADTSLQSAIDTLKQAADTNAVPPAEVSQAMLSLESAKLDVAEYGSFLGGEASPGVLWRLVFVASSTKGSGRSFYYPLTAAISFDSKTETMTNGAYFGYIASLKFKGGYSIKDRKVDLWYNTADIKVGPWKFSIDEKFPLFPKQAKDGKPGPFYLMAYADDDVLVMRGRGGGLAMWAKAAPSWALEKGIEWK